MSYFTLHHLFTLAARERCMTNLRKVKVPLSGKYPSSKAAVLVPLCSSDDAVSLLYTVRSQKLRTNSGQISFPGGKSDDGETPEQTALREAEEEIGLCPNEVDVWGHGPEIPSRNRKIMITPVIGCIRDINSKELKINNDEVSEVFAVSLESLCDKKNQYHTQFKNGFILPVFAVKGYRIWGLTAYITHVVLSSLLPKEVYHNEWIKKKIVIKNISFENC